MVRIVLPTGVDSGAVVAHVDGAVAGFSGDDQRVAVSEGWTRAVSVVDWRTGRPIWRSMQLVLVPGGVRSMPGGTAMALTVSAPSPGNAVPDLVLVRADGTWLLVSRSAEVLTLSAVGAAG
jgi:hypothetical protein